MSRINLMLLTLIYLNMSCHCRLILTWWCYCWLGWYQPNWSIELFCSVMKFKIFRLTPNPMIMIMPLSIPVEYLKACLFRPLRYDNNVYYKIMNWKYFSINADFGTYVAMHVLKLFISLHWNSSEVPRKIFSLTLNVFWGTIWLFRFC